MDIVPLAVRTTIVGNMASDLHIVVGKKALGLETNARDIEKNGRGIENNDRDIQRRTGVLRHLTRFSFANLHIPTPVDEARVAVPLESHTTLLTSSQQCSKKAYWETTSFDMYTNKIWILDEGDRDGNPNVTAKRALIVPPELAYGSKGVQEIPPHSTIQALGYVDGVEVVHACEPDNERLSVNMRSMIYMIPLPLGLSGATRWHMMDGWVPGSTIVYYKPVCKSDDLYCYMWCSMQFKVFFCLKPPQEVFYDIDPKKNVGGDGGEMVEGDVE
ncbi:hypothetical protein Tco_1201907 [Tanacetum coccineum]